MAYLRDLSDLSGVPLTSDNPGNPSSPEAKSRRPTITADGPFGSTTSTHSSAPGLRQKASMVSLRAGATSTATSDSIGSKGEEERKYKEDKKRRKGVINELVA
jgi:hypothetical protein